jgi:hypothetical protein
MAKRKTEFELESALPFDNIAEGCKVEIVGNGVEMRPFVRLDIRGEILCIKDRDLERFAVNILKALESNKLKK